MARPRDQRVKDTLELLQTEVDVWIATASGTGEPYLIPLSFYWMARRSSSRPRARVERVATLRKPAVLALQLGRHEDRSSSSMLGPRRCRLETTSSLKTPMSAPPTSIHDCGMSVIRSSDSFPSGSRRGEASTPRSFATKI